MLQNPHLPKMKPMNKFISHRIQSCIHHQIQTLSLTNKYTFSSSTNSIVDNHQKNFSWLSSLPKQVYITDVGPRDGLQNESSTTIIPVQVKVELINKLKQAGLKKIECGSFVSPNAVRIIC